MFSGGHAWSTDVILGCSRMVCFQPLNRLGKRTETSFCWKICGPHSFRSAESMYGFLPQNFGAIGAVRRMMGTGAVGTCGTPAYVSFLNAVFPSASLTSKLCIFLISATRAACPANVILISIVFGEKYKLWLSSLCNFLKPLFNPLRSR